MNERRRSAFIGMIFGYAGTMISLARNILFVPAYLHHIPLAEYGAWLATGGALALILINDYGLSGVVTQRMSASYGAQDFGKLGSLAGSALAIGGILALGLSLLSLVCAPLLPGLDSLSAAERHRVIGCFGLAVAANGLGILGATAASMLRSLQRGVLGGSILLASEICNVLVILIGLHAGAGLYAIACGVLARSLLLSVAGLAGVWLVFVRSLDLRVIVRGSAIRDLIGESSRFFLSAIAIRLQAQANVFFAGAILGPASAAIYSLTARAYETVLSLIILINGSLVPSVTHLLASGNVARFRVVVLRLLVFLSALTALVMSATLILNPAFLRLWVGGDVFGGQTLSVLMAVAIFVSSIGGIAYDALLAQGRFSLVTRFFLMTSVLQVVLLAVLLHWGLWAAPVATILTGCVWGAAFWMNVAKDIDLTGQETRRLAGELMRVVAVSAVGAAAFGGFYPEARTWHGFLIEGVACVAALAGGYLAASSGLRRIAFEEVRATLRLFRPAW